MQLSLIFWLLVLSRCVIECHSALPQGFRLLIRAHSKQVIVNLGKTRNPQPRDFIIYNLYGGGGGRGDGKEQHAIAVHAIMPSI